VSEATGIGEPPALLVAEPVVASGPSRVSAEIPKQRLELGLLGGGRLGGLE